MKKRLVSIIMISVMAASLAGCGSSSSSGSSADSASSDSSAAATTAAAEVGNGGSTAGVIKVSWWGNQARNDITQQVLDLYASQHEGVTFDGQFTDWASYWDKTATSAAGNSLPDVIQMDYKYLDQYATNGQLLDLTPYIDNGTIDVSDVSQTILDSGKVDGKLYAIPLGVNAPAIVYNKTLLDENGITIKDNMSVAEFEDVCRQVYEKTGYKTDICYGNGDNFIEYLMRSEGAVLYEDGKLGATQEQLEKFFDIYETGISEGWACSPEIYVERTIGSPEQMPLVYGSSPETRSWCAFSYSNSVTAIVNAANGEFETALTTYPADNEEAADYLKPAMFFSVAANTANADTVADFLNFWTNDQDANNILMGERGVPISSKVSAAISEKMDDTSKQVNAYINDVVTPTSSAINPPAPLGSSEVSDLIDQLEERVCYQQITAAEAAAELYEQGNQMMAAKAK